MKAKVSHASGRVVADAAVVVGMGFFWAILRNHTAFRKLFHLATANELTMLHAVFAATVGFTGIACAIWPSAMKRLTASRSRVLALGVMASFLAYLCSACTLHAPAYVFLACLVAALFGVAVAVLSCSWSYTVSCLSQRDAAPSVVGSVAFALLLSSGLGALGVICGLVSDDGPVRAAIAIFSPALSAAIWASRPMYFEEDEQTLAEGGTGPRTARSTVLMFGLAAFVLVGSFIRGQYYLLDSRAVTHEATLFANVVTMIFCALVIAVLLTRIRRERTFFICWALGAMVFFGVVVAIARLTGDGSSMAAEVAVVGRTILSPILWLTIVDSCSRRSEDCTSLMGGVFLITEALSSVVSYLLVPLLHSVVDFGEYGTVYLVATASIMAVSSFVVILFARMPIDIDDDEKSEGRPLDDEDRRRCEVLIEKTARMYGLSSRETQVLSLLYRDLGAERIAKELCVSANTAQTHSKHIYRKMGVHSRSEVIAAVDGQDQAHS